MLKNVSDYQKSFFKKLYKVELDIIKKMHESEAKLSSQIAKGSLNQDEAKILEVVSGKKKEDMKGKVMNALLTKLKKKSKEVNQN